MPAKRVFLSVPLVAISFDSAATEARYSHFYDQIHQVCEQHELSVYLPAKHGHPIKHDFVTPVAVYETNERQIAAADMLIAYVGLPSAGVGFEIGLAQSLNMPVVLLYEDPVTDQVSKMLRGCPVAQHQVIAPTLEDLVTKFESQLDAILKHLYGSAKAPRVEQPKVDSKAFKDLLTSIQSRCSMNQAEVSRRAGIRESTLSKILRDQEYTTHRDQIIKLCGWGWNLSWEETNYMLRSGGYPPLRGNTTELDRDELLTLCCWHWHLSREETSRILEIEGGIRAQLR